MRMPAWGAADVIERMELITKLRWVVWAIVLLGILVINILSSFTFNILPSISILVFVLLYNALSTYLLRSIKQKPEAAHNKNTLLLFFVASAAFDLAALTIGIYLTGGLASPYLLLLLICVLTAGIIFSPPANYIIATVANLAMIAATLVERQDRISNGSIQLDAGQVLGRNDYSSLASIHLRIPALSEIAMLVLFASLTYLGVYLVSYVAQRLRQGQQEANRVLYEQEKTLSQLAVLQQIGTEISSISELPTVLDLIVKKAQGVFSTDMAFLALQEPNSQDICITVTAGEKTEPFKEIKLRPGQGIGGLVMVSGEPIVVDDYATDPRLVGRPFAAVRDVQLKSGMAAPLSVGQRRIGVLYVFNRETTNFDDSDAEMLFALANQAAIAIENARLYDQLREASLTDSLTGLFNSRYLHERLQSEIARTTRYGGKLALVMADCDSLKEINDKFGHKVGDQLLVQLGKLMKNNLRESDVVTRYGGDEFVILLPEADVFAAQHAAERLRGKIAYTQLDAEGIQLMITISMGIATFPNDGAGVEDLLRRADNALARAKSLGKNRVCFIEPVV